MFDYYFIEMIKDKPVLQHNYYGITKKEYPKWKGWKIIQEYKANGIDAKSIKDRRLEVLVENFYYVKFLEEKYFNQTH